MDTKENVEVKNQPVAEEAVKESKGTNDTTTEHKSEKPDRSEDIIKSQTGQIQALQKQIEELKAKPDVKSTLKELLGDDNVESDVDPLETLKSEFSSLKAELNQTKAEQARDAYIDNLQGITEATKKYLKKRVTPSDDLETVVTTELEMINEVITSSTPTTSDNRPNSIGTVKGNITDADYILNNPEKFKS